MIKINEMNPGKETVGFEIVDGKYIWVPYQIVTKETADKIISK